MLRKNIMVLAILLVCILAVSAVSAEDNATGDVVGFDNEADYELTSQNNEVLTTDVGTFSKLNETINGNDDADVYLDGNYAYDSSSDGDFKNGIKLTRDVNIHGKGAIIDGGNIARIFQFEQCKIVISDINFQNAYTDMNGGAIYSFRAPTDISNCNFTNCYSDWKGGAVDLYAEGSLTNCNFNNCSSDMGAAFYFEEGSGSVVNCNFNNCSTGYCGIVYLVNSFTNVTDCTFTNCFSKGVTAGIHVLSDYCILTDCSFDNCSSAEEGGAIYWYSRYGHIADCTFTDCHSGLRGGAVYFIRDGEIGNCSFNNCSSFYGGAISSEYAKVIVVDNCSFDNCSSCNGGAIELETGMNAYILNCDFENCYSKKDSEYDDAYGDGGAITLVMESTIANCTFNKCWSQHNGGAIICLETNVSGCIFTQCSAYEGGAIYLNEVQSVDVYFCNFSQCNATDGGAIYLEDSQSANISVCNFTQCSAYDGGAMYLEYSQSANISVCNFNRCAADGSGGAICLDEGNATASNCNFTYNTAMMGGATYKTTVTKSFLSKNSATDYGGAMYLGSSNDCIFEDNTAGKGGNDNYTPQSKPVLNVPNFISTYNSADKLAVNLNDGGTPINGVNVTIRIYYSNMTFVKTYYCLSGDALAVGLNPGYYIAMCGVENQGYDVDGTIAMLNITQANSKLTSSGFTTPYNGGKYVVATLKDGNGKAISGVRITVKFSNGKTVTPNTDKNGQVKVSTDGLAPKSSYTVSIAFAGNVNYAKVSKSIKVTVKKAIPKLTASKKTFKKSTKTKKYTVTLKTNKGKVMKNTWVTLKVNKKTYKVKTNSKGVATFKLTKLTKKGKYVATVKYAGSKYYNAKTVKPKITIK